MKLIQRLEVCCYAHHISSLSNAQTELMMWKESLYASLHSNLVPLQVDKATSDLKNNNVRLKETLLKVINQNGWFYLNFLLFSVPWLIARYAERLAWFQQMAFSLLFQVRSSRNFCIDIILLCVILGIASYLYQ